MDAGTKPKVLSPIQEKKEGRHFSPHSPTLASRLGSIQLRSGPGLDRQPAPRRVEPRGPSAIPDK
ncbi:unnamed protein product [Clonostachys rosea]|uniref:Uncharacterized protein n=1 Tax=Bionectria ochroleuca TaxID=29856 RepID=A0ABY6U9Y0_BIOOC|nr:unnamed protein product [Clonostachys rosea]